MYGMYADWNIIRFLCAIYNRESRPQNTRRVVLHTFLPIIPCIMSDISGKLHENSLIRIYVMLLTGKRTDKRKKMPFAVALRLNCGELHVLLTYQIRRFIYQVIWYDIYIDTYHPLYIFCVFWKLAIGIIVMSLLIVIASLTHWGRVTHICVSRLTVTGSDNGFSPGRRQAIIWTNAGMLLIEPLGTNFSENLIEILTFSFTKMRLKVSSAKWRPFCLGLNVLSQSCYRV